MPPRGRPPKGSYTHSEQRRLYKVHRGHDQIFRHYYACGACDDLIRRIDKDRTKPARNAAEVKAGPYLKRLAEYMQHLQTFHRVTARDLIEQCGLPASLYEEAAPFFIR